MCVSVCVCEFMCLLLFPLTVENARKVIAIMRMFLSTMNVIGEKHDYIN